MHTKPQCIRCHFLCKTAVNDRGFESRGTWDENDRKTGRVKDHYTSECAESIWSTGVDPHIDVKHEIYRDRSKDCFAFVEFHRGMLFDGARKLRERKNSAERSRRERITLWIAVAGWITAAFMATITVIQAILH